MEGNTLYLNPSSGADANTGAKGRPLRTLAEAARRVNRSEGRGPMTLVLSEGIYSVNETTHFKPERRSFSKTERLTVRAEVLPDDPEWHTGRMPTLIHTTPLPKGWVNGMLVETSHVSVLGLKILGLPVVEIPWTGQLDRLYGISRLRPDLEDLEIGHCLFAGDKVTNPHHVGIIAMGNGVDVHHCIFRGMKISVVYWSGGSTGHRMRNCLCDGVYGSGVWTSGIANDFDYRNNVVMNSNYVWTHQSAASAAADAGGGRARQGEPSAAKSQENRYKVVDSYFAANRRLTGSGTGANLEYKDIDSSFLEMVGTKVVDAAVALEDDSTKRNYLHPVEGSEAIKAGAGLFTKPNRA